MSTQISQLYRESLQPYVDPELLEGVDYLPQQPEQIGFVQGVTSNKHSRSRIALALAIAGLCLIGSVYHHVAGTSQQLPPEVTTNLNNK